MKPESFVYWLQGFSEICNTTPTQAQWKIIQEHLDLVFDKKTGTRELEQSPVVNIDVDQQGGWFNHIPFNFRSGERPFPFGNNLLTC